MVRNTGVFAAKSQVEEILQMLAKMQCYRFDFFGKIMWVNIDNFLLKSKAKDMVGCPKLNGS